MKNSSKLILAAVLCLTMLVALSGCGGTEVTLADQSVNGVTLSVPSDFSEFTENNGAMVAKNADSTAVMSVSSAQPAGETTAADIDQDSFAASAAQNMTDVEFIEYDNAAAIDASPAIYAHFTSTNSQGVAIETYSYLMFHEDGNCQAVSFTYNTNGDNSLKDNIDAVLESITLA